MPPETEQHELEMRIAFLEDQIDGMNQVLVTQSRQIDRIRIRTETPGVTDTSIP